MKEQNAVKWLDGNNLSYDIWNNKYRFEGENFDHWLDRVSGDNKIVRGMIERKEFLFGGRTLSNRRTENGSSYSNCYSSGYAPDSVKGIMDLAGRIALTYKSEGGQGISMTKIRPKGAPVGEAGFTSDGIIPFMEIFNQVTSSISQGGSRKGALMLSIDAWHKEAEDFITIKSNPDKINKANLSVEVDNKFMESVKKFYTDGTTEVVERVFKCANGNEIEYEVTPIDIYKQMMVQAYDNAEPGVIFTDQFRNYNMMQYFDNYEIVTGNPCGEQPLPKDGACNLGSLNLSAFVVGSYTLSAAFDYVSFATAVRNAVRGLDEVLDEGMLLHAFKEQTDMAKNWRNIGLGIMGLGDMFFKLGITYGSEESIQLTDAIMSSMFRSAVFASNDLAKEKGTFPSYENKMLDSEIIRRHFTQEERDELKKEGMRNNSLLSVAPSGSIGTMLNITTGVEPAFMISYTRKTESLHKDEEVEYKVFMGAALEYKKMFGEDAELPEYFVTSADIEWKNRVDIQAIIQYHTDTAISSTVNLPNETTINEVEELYLYAWQRNLKGITIFRDGCARSQILFASGSQDKEETEIEEPTRMEIPDDTIYNLKKIYTGCGKILMMVGFSPSIKRITDIYVIPSGKGGCQKNITSGAIYMSELLRHGVSLDNVKRAIEGMDHCSSFAMKRGRGEYVSKGTTCSSAMLFGIEELKNELMNQDIETKPKPIKKQEKPKKAISEKVKCPECGEEIAPEGGCWTCHHCGFSKC